MREQSHQALNGRRITFARGDPLVSHCLGVRVSNRYATLSPSNALAQLRANHTHCGVAASVNRSSAAAPSLGGGAAPLTGLAAPEPSPTLDHARTETAPMSVR
jgi:hypothetical protein